MEIQTVIGLIILALDVWAIFHTVSSNASKVRKVLWVIIILVIPVLGLILWAFMGPRKNS